VLYFIVISNVENNDGPQHCCGREKSAMQETLEIALPISVKTFVSGVFANAAVEQKNTVSKALNIASYAVSNSVSVCICVFIYMSARDVVSAWMWSLLQVAGKLTDGDAEYVYKYENFSHTVEGDDRKWSTLRMLVADLGAELEFEGPVTLTVKVSPRPWGYAGACSDAHPHALYTCVCIAV
jgi:hypothetical protein